MKIETQIKGKVYTFELNRLTYKMLLQDKEYSKIQNQLLNNANDVKDIENNAKNMAENDVSNALLQDLIVKEKIFYYALKINQPEITSEQASDLMDTMIEEDGSMEYVNQIIDKLITNFTQRAKENKSVKREIKIL